MLSRRNFLKQCGLAAAALSAGCSMETNALQKAQPNVIIFFTDDQGTLDVNCYGSRDLYTPNMDKLAKQGIRFTQAYSHTVCCPARAMLMTGRYPQRGNVNTWMKGKPGPDPRGRNDNMFLTEVTLAEVLKTAGYRTALFGKWHLGADLDYGPTSQGFDEYFGHRGGFIHNYNHYYLHGDGYHDLYEGKKEVFADGQYFPDLVTARALNFVEKNKNNPFFMYMAFNVPHYPEQADSKFDDMYKDLAEPRRSLAKVISTADDRIGKVVDKLDALGIRENTIIIFQSDNGHSTEDYTIIPENHASGLPAGTNYGANGGGGNTGKWRGAKGSFFEGGLRVPSIISLPGTIPQNQVRDQAITLMDWLPTVADLCGVSVKDLKLDGKSIMPIINSPDAPTHNKIMHWQWQNGWTVRKGNWKLIANGRDSTDKWQGHPGPKRKIPKIFLANLTDDQPEYKNYADEQPQIVKELTDLHNAWYEDVMN